ncbi:MAG: shikimate dehydrogenase [Actinomycetes bacterium]
MTAATPRRAAVLGSPIGHSLSPTLHRAAYEALGLTGWTYEAYDVTEDRLGDFLAGLDPTWAGLSLTMPLKAAVLPMLDGAAPVVDVVGAANTVLVRDGRLIGENTDVPGMIASLAHHEVDAVDYVAVLGAGATARSALASAAAVTGSVTVYSRSATRAESLHATGKAVGVDVDVKPWSAAAEAFTAPLVVNTSPAGAADGWVRAVPREVGTLLEVVYDPWPTPLVAAWTARQGRVVDGLDLLVRQAVLQVGLMTGAEVDVPGLADLLRSAGERALRSA